MGQHPKHPYGSTPFGLTEDVLIVQKASTLQPGNGDGPVVTLVGTPTPGNVLIAFFGTCLGAASYMIPPVGWTLGGSEMVGGQGSNNLWMGWAYRVIQPGDGKSYTFAYQVIGSYSGAAFVYELAGIAYVGTVLTYLSNGDTDNTGGLTLGFSNPTTPLNKCAFICWGAFSIVQMVSSDVTWLPNTGSIPPGDLAADTTLGSVNPQIGSYGIDIQGKNIANPLAYDFTFNPAKISSFNELVAGFEIVLSIP